MIYNRNKEGYPDPTAGMALANIIKQERFEQKRKYKRKHKTKRTPKRGTVINVSGCLMMQSRGQYRLQVQRMKAHRRCRSQARAAFRVFRALPPFCAGRCPLSSCAEWTDVNA